MIEGVRLLPAYSPSADSLYVGRTFLNVEPSELNTYIQYTHDVKVHLRLSAQCRGKDTTFSAIMQEVW